MTIPKIIHYCWLSDDPFPVLNAKCFVSWKKLLPNYEIMLWDVNQFDIKSVPWVHQAFQKRKYAFAADYIRLFALYWHGGIYFDADVEVIKSLDGLLQENVFIGFDSVGDIEAAVIGARPGSRRIKKCLDYYNGRNFVSHDGSFDLKPLPIILRNHLFSVDEFNSLESKKISRLNEITVYPSTFFSPKDRHTGVIAKTSNSYSVHHFDGAWVNKNVIYKTKNFIHYVLRYLLADRYYSQAIDFIRKMKS